MSKPKGFDVYYCPLHAAELIERFLPDCDVSPAWVKIEEFGALVETHPVLCEVEGCEKEAHTSFSITIQAESSEPTASKAASKQGEAT